MQLDPRPSSTASSAPPPGAEPVRVLHVLGHAGTGAELAGMTGVERVVELLLQSMGPGFRQSVVYPEDGCMRDRFGALAAAMLARIPRSRWDRAYIAAVAAFAAHEKTQVLVSHGLRYDFHAAWAARTVRARHWVSRAVALADDSYSGWPARLYRLADAWTLRACDGIIAVSQASKTRMIETQGLSADRITVIPNGVPVPQVAPAEVVRAREELGAAPGEVLVGGMGQLIPRKNFAMLIDAVGRLPHPRPRVALLGEGPERAALQALAQALDVTLVLAGFRSNPHAFLAAFDLHVLPSRAEGMPMSILESMALGVPCIATPAAGTAEVIEDGICGILVPMEDTAALAAAIARLLDAPAERQRLGAAAARRIAAHYSVDAMVQSFRSVLGTAAQGRA